MSGEATVSSVLNRGLAANASAPPARMSAIRSSGSACVGLSTNVTCLWDSSSTAAYSISSRSSMGTSLAVTVVHMTSTAGDSSSRAVAARKSASVEGRRSPVAASSTNAAHPDEQKRVGWSSARATS